MFDGAHHELSPVREVPPPPSERRQALSTNTSDDVFFSPVRTSQSGGRARGEEGEEVRQSASEEFDQIQPNTATALQHVSYLVLLQCSADTLKA